MKRFLLLIFISSFFLSAVFVSPVRAQQTILENTVEKMESKKMPDGSTKALIFYKDGSRTEKEINRPKEPKVQAARFDKNGNKLSLLEEGADGAFIRTVFNPDGTMWQRAFTPAEGTKNTLIKNPDGSWVRIRSWMSGATDTTISSKDGATVNILERANGTSMERTADKDQNVITETHYDQDGKPTHQTKIIEGILHRREETTFKEGKPVKTIVQEGKDEVLKNFEEVYYDQDGNIEKRVPVSAEAQDLQETAQASQHPAPGALDIQSEPSEESKRQIHE